MTTKHFLVIALTITSSAVLAARPHSHAPTVTRLVSGLEGGAGSTIGPGGALYVTEPAAGRISRVDPGTGNVTIVASGLPPAIIGVGGAMDVAFIGKTGVRRWSRWSGRTSAATMSWASTAWTGPTVSR